MRIQNSFGFFSETKGDDDFETEPHKFFTF